MLDSWSSIGFQWKQTMDGPFLTELDGRAAVKGSRDPLGTQSIWSALGRRVVSNLSTVSTSVRDFTTLMLGYHFAEELSAENPAATMDVFLRWEQWAAYSRYRHAKNGTAIRGIERVKERMEGRKSIWISAERVHQILSQQHTYGLWGIYSSPAKVSGLLQEENGRRTLTPEARDFVRPLYLNQLSGPKPKPDLKELLRLSAMKLHPDGQHEGVLKTIGTILSPKIKARELDFYRSHLLEGGPVIAEDKLKIQKAAAEKMPVSLLKGDSWLSPAVLRAWVKAAGKDSDLGRRLEQIAVAEAVLAPASNLFGYLGGRDRCGVGAVVKEVRDQWKGAFKELPLGEFAELRGMISESTRRKNGGDEWLGVAAALQADDFHEAIEGVRKINTAVMADRGGAPWILTEQGKFQVRYGESRMRLAKKEELPAMWYHSYFLDSLAAVSRQLSLPA